MYEKAAGSSWAIYSAEEVGQALDSIKPDSM